MTEPTAIRFSRACAITVVSFFFICTAGAGVVDSLAPLPINRNEGLACQAEARMGAEARILDGTEARWIEHLLAERRRRGASVVDLLDALVAARDRGEVVSTRTDTHWSPHGAAVAAEETARVVGLRVRPESRSTEMRSFQQIDDFGDIMSVEGF